MKLSISDCKLLSRGQLLHLPGLTRWRRMRLPAALTSAMMLAVCLSAGGQTTADPNPQPPSGAARASLPDAPLPQAAATSNADDREAVTVRNAPIHTLEDQAVIWTSPVRLRSHDLKWLVPLTLATGAAIATDHRAMSSVVSNDPTFNHDNVDVSNVLIGSLIAAPVILFGTGEFEGDAHSTETGILGGEALVNGLVVEEAMKVAVWRERPSVDQARGRFFQTGAGADSSFPSAHSTLAWSSAAVLAEEYPSRWVQFGVYSMATGVSLTRVLGQEHFPSDVLVGAAAGWLIGHYVYRRHHRYSLEAR